MHDNDNKDSVGVAWAIFISATTGMARRTAMRQCYLYLNHFWDSEEEDNDDDDGSNDGNDI